MANKNKSFHLDKSGIAILAVLALIVGVYFGFSKTIDDIPESELEVLADAREYGFDFDSTLLKIDGEESLDTVVVNGPMVGPREIPAPGTQAPDKSYDDCVPYTSLTLKYQSGSWVAVNAVRDSRY